MFRKCLFYFTMIETSNHINSLRSSSIKTFIRIVPRPFLLVGKLSLGGIWKFNSILVLRSWKLSRYFSIEMVSLLFPVVICRVWIFVNFISDNILNSRALIWTKLWYTSCKCCTIASQPPIPALYHEFMGYPCTVLEYPPLPFVRG